MPTKLNNADFMKFPLTIGAEGAALSDRRAHIREQIEQVLFTHPGERWFRPEFGVGVRALVFEPNSSLLWEVTRKQMIASMAEALRGEVDPASLEVSVEGDEAKLLINISYTLAAINHAEQVQFAVQGG